MDRLTREQSHHEIPRLGNPAEFFYGDLPPAVQKKWVDKLQYISLETFRSKVSFEPWKHGFNCLYVVCEKDRAIPRELQEEFAAQFGKGRSWYIDSSHSPFLSKPEKVVEVIEAAAKGEKPEKVAVSAKL
jgi:pimeloyl-ACP methyl ester carboxylesterase